MKTETASERRIFPRNPVKIPGKLTFEKGRVGRGILEGTVLDVGIGGARLLVSVPGAPLSGSGMSLQLGPLNGHRAATVTGRLAWSNAASGAHGVEFSRLDDISLEELKPFLWPSSDLIRSAVEACLKFAPEEGQEKRVRAFFEGDVKGFLSGQMNAVRALLAREIERVSGQKEIDFHFDRIADIGDELDQFLAGKLAGIEIKKAFRDLIGPWVYKSRIIRLAYEKPRGYPGDYEMLEFIYNDRTVTPGAGKYLDRYFLNNGYAEAVRQRKNKMAEIIARRLEAASVPVRVLDIACGSCREILDILGSRTPLAGRLDLTILDQDTEAVDFSERRLKKVAPSLRIQCVKQDVLNLLKPEAVAPYPFLKNQDLVYSIGLADYFPDRILMKFIRGCMDLLSPIGEFVLAHKDRDADHHSPLLPDWFCDWKFYPRNEWKVGELIRAASPGAAIEAERDLSKRIIFFRIKRR